MVIRVKLEEKQMDEQEKFKQEKDLNIKELSRKKYREIGVQFVTNTAQAKYSYNFCWMGRPIIQFPQDMVAVQELIWEIKLIYKQSLLKSCKDIFDDLTKNENIFDFYCDYPSHLSINLLLIPSIICNAYV